jgi:hypothetical protein
LQCVESLADSSSGRMVAKVLADGGEGPALQGKRPLTASLLVDSAGGHPPCYQTPEGGLWPARAAVLSLAADPSGGRIM